MISESIAGVIKMNKILDGAKQAVEVAKCDHDLDLASPDVKNPAKLSRLICRKCLAIFYVPK